MASVPALNLQMIQNPFAMKLSKPSDCSLDGVTCLLSSQVPWMLQTFWGVTVEELRQVLYSDWTTFKELVLSDGLLLGSCLQKGELQHLPECCEKLVDLAPPSKLSEDDLGIIPRTKYPLVLLMMRNDIIEPGSDIVVAMVNIIHIKDNICNKESCILVQYLKKISGQTSFLKPLYVASDDNIMDTNEATDVEEKCDNLCVVCQTKPISRALLPCRHTCICDECFKEIDKCPMCRSHISSYFCIKNEESSSRVDDGLPGTNLRQKIERCMDRLNSYLGLS